MNAPILRIFPYRTSYTPTDDYALISHPELAEIEGQVEMENVRQPLPPHDEIHISCTFTWDKALCIRLQELYQRDTNKPVKLGGPAFGSPAEDFIQGMYIAKNIIFTTRGCNNNCSFCCVPNLEGKLRELPICQGNIIQDNNFLQASRTHKDKVFDMLKTQKGVCFKGGLQCNLIDDHFTDALQSLYYTRGSKKISRIGELWLACDSDAALPGFRKACERLTKAGFDREKIHCYALIGDDMDKNEARLREIYHAGAMPFAMLYRDFGDTRTEYGKDWNGFSRMWQRPALIKKHMEAGMDWRMFGT